MDIKEILDDFDSSQGMNAQLYRNRDYVGQPHTDAGERGKTEVKGITMRDVVDCFVLGAFDASGDQFDGEFYEKAQHGNISWNDIYKLDLDKIDPIAWSQNMMCRIEKLMGIFPNVPKPKIKEP